MVCANCDRGVVTASRIWQRSDQPLDRAAAVVRDYPLQTGLAAAPPWQARCHALRIPAIESVGDFLVLRGGGTSINLQSGRPLTGINASTALSVTRAFGASSPQIIDTVERDQWTVSGDFNNARPLYRIALNDAADTHLYVSQRDGRVVQRVTASERFWNYLGAVPHWLYFTALRRNGSAIAASSRSSILRGHCAPPIRTTSSTRTVRSPSMRPARPST